jgi:hypothetical protein
MPRIGSLMLVCCSVFLLWGCGPVQYAATIMEASEAAENAKASKAWEWACYEYYAAETYMRKAVEEAGHSDFEAATLFASRAAKLAKAAKQLSEIRKVQQKKPPVTCDAAKIMEERYIKEKQTPGNNYLRKLVVE